LLGPKLMGALIRALDEAVGNGSRALVIRSGLRHFSAGADLDLFDDDAAAPQPDEAAAGGGTGSQAVGAVDFLRAFELAPIPIIVSVEGACLGGGLELALACDYIIAAASAKFGSVESALGLHPLMGAVQRQVQRIGMARAKEMSMLGRRYDAATLERWGLINLVVADETLEAATLAIAEEFANGPTIAHAATKKLAYIAANEGVAAADAAMAEIQKPIWASEDLKAGLVSLRKNGPGLARFEGK
ncbi:MAG TPA: enoyl-CoA hydratase/isomerase family protein, partial [Phenylobacterium sp.]